MVRARMTRFCVQPCGVGLRIIPTNAHHRVAVGLREARIFPNHLRILLPFENGAAPTAAVAGRVTGRAYESCVLTAGYVVPAERERRQRDLVLWRFVRDGLRTPTVRRSPRLLRVRRAHDEVARRDDDHLGALGTLAEGCAP